MITRARYDVSNETNVIIDDEATKLISHLR